MSETAKNKTMVSGQNSASSAWYWNCNSSFLNSNYKTYNYSVRAVCAFSEQSHTASFTSEILPFEDIYDAYLDSRRHERASHDALAFELDLESNLVSLWKSLLDGSYRRGRCTAFIVERPRVREVFAAPFRDKVVDHYVVRRLEPLMEAVFIDDNCSCRTGKGTLYGVKRLEDRLALSLSSPDYDELYVAKFDIENFFMSIHKPTLWGMLRDFIAERYRGADKGLLLRLVRMIVMHCPASDCIRRSPPWKWDRLSSGKSLFCIDGDRGLPIGSFPSHVFTNFLLSRFDLRFLDDGHSARYADDFYIIGHKEAVLSMYGAMRWELESIGLTLHRRKHYFQHISKGVTFLGAQCLPGRTYVRRSTVYNAVQMIEDYGATEDKESLVGEFVQRLNSYLGYMSHFNSYSLRVRLCRLVDSSWRRYIYFSSSFRKACVRRRFRRNVIDRNSLRQGRHGRRGRFAVPSTNPKNH